jgi:hypothetical protein
VQKVAAGNAAAAALFAAGKPKPAWTTAEGRPTAGDIVRITSSVNDLLVEDICNVLKDTTDGAPYTLAKIGGPKVEVQPTSPEWSLVFLQGFLWARSCAGKILHGVWGSTLEYGEGGAWECCRRSAHG